MCTNSSFGTCVPGRYIAVGLSSGVAVKRGSTVYRYSRRIIWPKVGVTSNKPEVIAHHFIESVLAHVYIIIENLFHDIIV